MWAIMHNQVLSTSLGYYLNPLVNVLLGRLVLKEQLNRWQAAAVVVAATGVGILLFEEPGAIWISITLALSFGTYGLVRKMTPVSAVSGLAVEVTLLAPIAAVALALGLASGDGFGSSPHISLLLMGSGLMTAIPLLLFATAARRMSYTALGFVQYMAPTIVFFLSVFFGKSRSTQQSSYALPVSGRPLRSSASTPSAARGSTARKPPKEKGAAKATPFLFS